MAWGVCCDGFIMLRHIKNIDFVYLKWMNCLACELRNFEK